MKRLNTSIGISGITSLLMGITTLLFCYSVSAEEYNDWSGQYAGMSLGVMAGKVNPSTTVTKGISYYSQDEDVTKLNRRAFRILCQLMLTKYLRRHLNDLQSGSPTETMSYSSSGLALSIS